MDLLARTEIWHLSFPSQRLPPLIRRWTQMPWTMHRRNLRTGDLGGRRRAQRLHHRLRHLPRRHDRLPSRRQLHLSGRSLGDRAGDRPATWALLCKRRAAQGGAVEDTSGVTGMASGKIPRGSNLEEPLTQAQRAEFRSVTGCLQWVAGQSRPELSAVNSLSNHGGFSQT